jgi:deoxyribonuclease-4
VIVGAHCSGGIKRSLERAAEIGADALQLFVQSPRAWRFPQHDPADLERFRSRREELGLGAVLVHTLYLVNLASPDDTIYEKSASVMRSTMQAACALDADGVVFHVGSHLGAGFEAGRSGAPSTSSRRSSIGSTAIRGWGSASTRATSGCRATT